MVAQEADTARKNDGFFRVCVLAKGDEGVAGELAMVSFSLLYSFLVLSGCLMLMIIGIGDFEA